MSLQLLRRVRLRKVLDVYSKFLDALEKVIGAVIVTLLFVSFVIIFAQVITRYIFASGFPWMEEAAIFMSIWMAFLGAAVAIRKRKHMYIDIIEAKLPHLPRMTLNVLSDLLMIAFFVIMIVIGHSYATGNRTNLSAGLSLSMMYVYFSLVVGMAIAVLYAVEIMLKRLVTGKVHPE